MSLLKVITFDRLIMKLTVSSCSENSPLIGGGLDQWAAAVVLERRG